MSSQPKFSSAQWKSLKHTLSVSRHDLNYAVQPLVGTLQQAGVSEKVMKESLRSAGQRALYLVATDAAAGFGIDIPESAKCPKGRLRNLVDSQARRLARQAG